MPHREEQESSPCCRHSDGESLAPTPHHPTPPHPNFSTMCFSVLLLPCLSQTPPKLFFATCVPRIWPACFLTIFFMYESNVCRELKIKQYWETANEKQPLPIPALPTAEPCLCRGAHSQHSERFLPITTALFITAVHGLLFLHLFIWALFLVLLFHHPYLYFLPLVVLIWQWPCLSCMAPVCITVTVYICLSLIQIACCHFVSFLE